MSGSSSFQVNDPVHVERSSGSGDQAQQQQQQQLLEGVVAFVGRVQFADGDDWVGVRLTGKSVGLGKNDGSVKGVTYFTTGPNGGVFVRSSHVSKRELSKLEALRLKRELAKKASATAASAASTTGGVSAAAVSTTPSTKPTAASSKSSSSSRTISTPSTSTRTSLRTPGTRSPKRPSTGASLSSSVSAAKSTPTAAASSSFSKATATATSSSSAATSSFISPSKQSRMDEIRARRAALAEKQKAGSSSSSTLRSTAAAATLPTRTSALVEGKDKDDDTSQEQVALLQEQVNKLTTQLQSKQQECESLRLQQQATLSPRQVQRDDKQQDITAQRVQELETELQSAKQMCQDTDKRLQEALTSVQSRQQDLDDERQRHEADLQQLTQLRTELSAVRAELQQVSSDDRRQASADVSHYKELAKLQAEVAAAKRQVQELEKEKMDTEGVLEEVALDKEALQEEKEALEDRLEELKVDAETAQMEAEELKSELEIAKEAAEQGGGGSAAAAQAHSIGGADADADEVARGLSVQNARLREALIRLREQSSFEQMELSRQLRTLEKDAANVTTLTEEVESLRENKRKVDEEIRDLKEMVDQGSAFESMVESLSDRVLLLEDDAAALQTTIREMEEAAEITAEMEEVQADENKTLMRDLEGRDAIIRNLEEAIKMQRRREDDFQRTVGNYRKSVETLRQEKKALMAFQEGDEGEKGDLLATSQKALARAAQLVADAAIARKREAEAVFDRIDADVHRHLSQRLESLLPENVSSTEIASIKGEMLLSRVAGKASKTLEGLASVFGETIRSGVDRVSSEVDENMTMDEGMTFQLTDESRQSITNMFHQGNVAISTIGVSSELLKLLSAGQWPDLLSPEVSSDLGATAGNSIAELDVVLGDQLRLLKEEGVLSPHTSNIGAFQQAVQTTMQSLHTTLEVDDSPLVSKDWSPPGWTMLKDVSISKFSCMCAGAIVGSAVNPDDGANSGTTVPTDPTVIYAILPLMTKLDQIRADATRACFRLARLDLRSDATVSELSELSALLKMSSVAMMKTTQEKFSSETGFTRDDLAICESAADTTMRELVRFSSALRTASLIADSDERFHPLSPEAKDAWEGVASIAQTMRSVDGDPEDVNYLLRARSLEDQLREGVENGPKLSLANAKISSLEKSLSTRSKEIAMQNARITELEKVFAKSSSAPSPRNIKSSDLSVSEEMNTLTEENRVLTEAMDVLHRQVDEYENEIRSLKDFKSPKSAQRRSSMSSRASPFMPPSFSGNKSGTPAAEVTNEASAASIGAMEAVLLRPALQAARQDASRYKAQAISTALNSLPPLMMTSTSSEDSKYPERIDELQDLAKSLSDARSQVRTHKASVSVVDLSSTAKSPRQSLLESKAKTYACEMKLADAVAATERYLLDNRGVSVVTDEAKPLLGTVKFGGPSSFSVPLTVDKAVLNRLHSSMLR